MKTGMVCVALAIVFVFIGFFMVEGFISDKISHEQLIMASNRAGYWKYQTTVYVSPDSFSDASLSLWKQFTRNNTDAYTDGEISTISVEFDGLGKKIIAISIHWYDGQITGLPFYLNEEETARFVENAINKMRYQRVK